MTEPAASENLAEPFEPDEAFLFEFFGSAEVRRWAAGRLGAVFASPRLGRVYLVIPSIERPRYIVPWSGRASRTFFRHEAGKPHNSRARYALKWMLASLGVAQFFAKAQLLIVR